MPRRTDIKSILVIGAGPIIIGQACEFDYSGTQACKALRDEGYRVILVNSNPATIMTDPEFADATYIEPVTPEIVAKIIAIEKPDALLPTMGGQTALNTALALADEARALLRVNSPHKHPHVLEAQYVCSPVGRANELLFLQELIRGASLAELLERGQLYDVAEGEGAAPARGEIHPG